MLKSHPFNWIATIILVLVAGVWLFMNYGYIEEHHLKDAVVESKSEGEEGKYIKVDGKTLLVEEESLWMMVKEKEAYEIIYESYGTKTPYVVSIDQAADEEHLDGGH
ncbi:hypothetical protein [Halobacillus massiliensis]|uniref:hypothetical protein n=1 Tax=Halobacillus massiliensis TaxID=1926286 RepID=UPI0009E2595B|nr:hypothetical protein [Halobacillus massiliensis]